MNLGFVIAVATRDIATPGGIKMETKGRLKWTPEEIADLENSKMIGNNKKIALKLIEIIERYDEVEMAIELFELGERMKGNPACPHCGGYSQLPAEIEALYAEHDDLASDIYVLSNPPYQDPWYEWDNEFKDLLIKEGFTDENES
jgi:hypothetical protein